MKLQMIKLLANNKKRFLITLKNLTKLVSIRPFEIIKRKYEQTKINCDKKIKLNN